MGLERRIVVIGAVTEGDGEFLLLRYKVSVKHDEVLDMGCRTSGLQVTILHYMFKTLLKGGAHVMCF